MTQKLLMLLAMFMFAAGTTWAEDEQTSTVSFADQVANATQGSTITLTEDVTLASTVTIGKSLTIDLGGHSITADDNVSAMHITSGTVTITGTGTITTGAAIRVGTGDGETLAETLLPVALNVGSGVTISCDNDFALRVSGSDTDETVTLDGTVTGYGGIEAKSGNVTITDNANIDVNVNFNDDGMILSGYAVVAHNSLMGKVSVKGGKIRGFMSIFDPYEGIDNDASICISGGIFYDEPTVDYIAEGYEAVLVFGDEGKYFEIMTHFAALFCQELPDDKTITLEDDYTLMEPFVYSGSEDVILDLNGHSVSSSALATIVYDGTATFTVKDTTNVGSITNSNDNGIAVWLKSGEMIIEGGLFQNCSYSQSTVFVGDESKSYGDAYPKMTIKGGEFKNTWVNSGNTGIYLPLTLDVLDALVDENHSVQSMLSAQGGTFYGNDPGNGDQYKGGTFVAEHYKSFTDVNIQNCYIVGVSNSTATVSENVVITNNVDKDYDVNTIVKSGCTVSTEEVNNSSVVVKNAHEINVNASITIDTEVSGLDCNSVQTGLITQAQGNVIAVDKLKAAIDNDLIISTDVTLTRASVEAVESSGNNAPQFVVKAAAFDVTPTASVIVENKKLSTKIPNEAIKKAIGFVLPISNYGNYKNIEVKHAGVSKGNYPINDLGTTVTTLENGKQQVVQTGFSKVFSPSFSEFSYELVESVKMKAYHSGATSGEDVEIDKDTWETYLSAHKNAVAIVPEQYEVFAQSTSNVLVEYEDEENGTKSYVCPNLVLTDMEDFYSPYDFTATTGSYERHPNFKSNAGMCFNSVCVPFALKEGDLSTTAKLLTYSSHDFTKVYFESQTGIAAGEPCLVWESESDWAAIAFNNTPIVGSPVQSANMEGSFVKHNDWAQDESHFSVGTNNKFDQLQDYVFPFRSCLYLGGGTGSGLGSLSIVIDGVDNPTTDIYAPLAVPATTSDDILYDLNGRKVDASSITRGIYIRNNNKVIIK